MQRKIIGFYQDPEGQWTVQLDCGHTRHVRHNPPWEVREWVTTEAGRTQWVGKMMECTKCDEDAA